MPAKPSTIQALLLPLLLLFACYPSISAGAAKQALVVTTGRRADTDTFILKNCNKAEQVEKIITEAISIGAPVYNSGYHLACYRIYEWAAYKILYEYGSNCKDLEKILKAAVEKSHGDYSDLEKAWIMRVAFDKIMGVPTQTVDPEKKPDPNRKG